MTEKAIWSEVSISRAYEHHPPDCNKEVTKVFWEALGSLTLRAAGASITLSSHRELGALDDPVPGSQAGSLERPQVLLCVLNQFYMGREGSHLLETYLSSKVSGSPGRGV